MPLIMLLTTMEANLSIITNSTPMLLPLYTWWRYRRVWGEGADDYVSRLRGDDNDHNTRSASHARGARGAKHPEGQSQWRMVEDIVSGVPLEAIYGVDHVHFTTTVRRGGGGGSSRNNSGDSGIKMTATRTRTRSNGEQDRDDDRDGDVDLSDSESTWRLPRNAQATGHAGIQIETKWSITEETV